MVHRIALAVGLTAAVSACGGSSSSSSGSTCSPTSTAAFTIAAAGVSPKAVCVLPGGTVNFTNSDAAAEHSVASDGTCTALDLGAIAPSTSKSATMGSVATCRFHDPNDASNTAFQGVVAVTQQPVGGGGGAGY